MGELISLGLKFLVIQKPGPLAVDQSQPKLSQPSVFKSVKQRASVPPRPVMCLPASNGPISAGQFSA